MFDGPWESCMLVKGLDPSACASWVQAWGSIGALLIAILLAWYQQRSTNKAMLQQAHKERLASHEAFIEISDVALKTLSEQISEIYPAGGQREQMSDAAYYVSLSYAPSRTESHLRELLTISIATLRSAESIRTAIALKEELLHCQAMTIEAADAVTEGYVEWCFKGGSATISLEIAQKKLFELRKAKIFLEPFE